MNVREKHIDFGLPPTMSIQELLRRPIPPLFDGVGRAMLATINPKKIEAATKWVQSHGIIRGERELPVYYRKVSGSEPAGHDAFSVSKHKVDMLIKQLDGEYGPETLVAGFDTVHARNGKFKYNMSRMDRLTSVEINAEINELVEDYSHDGAEARWDNCMTVSRPGLEVSTGDCVIALMRRIPPRVIYSHVYDHVPECKGYNAVLPLIDHEDFLPYIAALGIIPMVDMVDRQTGELREWTCDCSDRLVPDNDPRFLELREQAKTAIVGGIPRRETLAIIEAESPYTRSAGWVIV